MNHLYHNKLIAEFPRATLEEDFLQSCVLLDQRAHEIVELEKEAASLAGNLELLSKDLQDKSKQEITFSGRQAPLAYRQTCLISKELNEQIEDANRNLAKATRKRDEALRDLRYHRSLLNYPSTTSVRRATQTKGLGKITISQLIDMLTELKERNKKTQISSRIQASIALLNSDFEAAATSMKKIVESVGDRFELFDNMDLQSQLEQREKQLDQLHANYNQLKHQHDLMKEKHQNALAQYQKEADLNNQRYSRIMDLQHQKEALEAEVAQIEEAQIRINYLQKGLETLDQQKAEIATGNEAKLAAMKTSMEETIEATKAENYQLDSRVLKLRQVNRELERKIKQMEQKKETDEDRFEQLSLNEHALEQNLNQAQIELTHLIAYDESDPFEKPQFKEFLNQMIQQGLVYSDLKLRTDSITQLKKDIEELSERIAQYEKYKSKVTDSIETKRQLVADLDAQLKPLLIDLGVAESAFDDQEAPIRPDFTPESPHLEFVQEQLNALKQDQIAILLYVGKLDLKPGVVEKKRGEIFLVIDFDEHPTMTTASIGIENPDFNEAFCYAAKNDFQLRDYIEQSAVQVTLYQSNAMRRTEIGHGALIISMFADHIEAFSSRVPLVSPKSNEEIGAIHYESRISGTLLEF